MADQRLSQRASGAVRWLGVLALLVGIAAMHAGAFSVATGAAHDMGGPAHVMAAPMAMPQDAVTPAHAAAMNEHPAPIHVRHACEVFTLAAVAFAIGLVLLGWLSRPADIGLPASRDSRPAHRERPPPWTFPSLSQLSILRI
ncbi:DUF6153 family protein [Nocardia seriolae]|uniref:DUF6153 family protein n=1 Tax=Nocardia seriolae TaxID=37332 RepID=UPI001E4D4926|nr:DUF6153 family protein [Nocardia seriolae]WKY50918.1 DUF6153 family protein [Nocardia seriolae]